jgi:tetratricopeptide (TPR) repeat protein
MGFGEAIVKIVFWPRVRKAQKIGEAAELIGQGRAEETLEILASMERRIPPYVGHLFFLTRGRALDELDRFEEAEQAYLAAVFAKEGATVAYIHLAVLCGRQRRFDDAKDWLRRIREDAEADPALLEQAEELETMLGDIESGRREAELEARASSFAEAHGLTGLDLDAALGQLELWIEKHPELVESQCDELACYLGQTAVDQLKGRWSMSLSLEECSVDFDDESKRPFSPFQMVSARLEGQGSLSELFAERYGPEASGP